jgi:amino acid transporter
MWVDLLISAPINLFLLWLYRYSAPSSAPVWLRRLDVALLLVAALSVVLIIVLGHRFIDYPGMGLNVMLVAAAYCVLVTLLGIGWGVRWLCCDGRDSDHARLR